MILAIDPGLRHLGATVASLEGRVVDAWLPRSTAKARMQEGQRIPAPEGALAWRGMVLAVVEGLRARGHLERITVLVLEWPEIYKEEKRGKLQKTNPNDLLELAAVLGGLACLLPAVQRYERFTPRAWKRSFPKGDYQRAIINALSEEERGLLLATPESLRHNVIESIGLARFMSTVLRGQPISVPAFQMRAQPLFPEKRTRPAPRMRTPPADNQKPGTNELDLLCPFDEGAPLPSVGKVIEKVPAYRTRAPPDPKAPTYGQRHGLDKLVTQQRQRATHPDLRARASSVSYPKGKAPR